MIRLFGLGAVPPAPPISPSRRVTVRQAAGVGVGVFVVLVMALMTLAVTNDPGQTLNSGNGFLDRAFFGILVVPVTWGAVWYFLIPRVVIDDSGVAVHNPYRSWVLPWPVVAGAGFDRSLAVVLADGDRVRSILFGPAFSSPLTTRARVDQIVELINQEAARRSGRTHDPDAAYAAEDLINPDQAVGVLSKPFPEADTMRHTNRGLIALVVIAVLWTVLCALAAA